MVALEHLDEAGKQRRLQRSEGFADRIRQRDGRDGFAFLGGAEETVVGLADEWIRSHLGESRGREGIETTPAHRLLDRQAAAARRDWQGGRNLLVPGEPCDLFREVLGFEQVGTP